MAVLRYPTADQVIMKRHFLLLPLLLVLLPGCAAKFTNLTPQRLPRSATGLYPFEVAMTSQEQALKWDTIEPMVRIGQEFYPMQPMPLITNRWEVMIPIPPETEIVHYSYQFLFHKREFGGVSKDSAWSGRYYLQIVDPKPAPPPQ